MNDTATTKPREKVLKVNTVIVHTPRGPETFYVRHYDARQAQAWVTNARVESRPATQDELMDIGRNNRTILGPFEEGAAIPPDDGQQDAFLDRDPDNE